MQVQVKKHLLCLLLNIYFSRLHAFLSETSAYSTSSTVIERCEMGSGRWEMMLFVPRTCTCYSSPAPATCYLHSFILHLQPAPIAPISNILTGFGRFVIIISAGNQATEESDCICKNLLFYISNKPIFRRM